MSGYAVAHLDEIDELDDGREPFRPVRHHLGITAFGVNAWTGHNGGDRILNEHDEAEEDEELYVVLQGRARFELDGERVDAPVGTLVFARPGVKRTAFAEEPETTILALGGTQGEAYEPDGWELWAPLRPLYEQGEYAAAAERGRGLGRGSSRVHHAVLQPRLLREPRRSDDRGARAPPPLDRDVGAVS